MKKWIIDYIDQNAQIVKLINDEETLIEAPMNLFDKSIAEGDVINISIDKDETRKRRDMAKKLMDELFED